VRTHAAWAVGQIGSAEAAGPLLSRADTEDDLGVLVALRSALDCLDS
jgi:hypothetical protein